MTRGIFLERDPFEAFTAMARDRLARKSDIAGAAALAKSWPVATLKNRENGKPCE